MGAFARGTEAMTDTNVDRYEQALEAFRQRGYEGLIPFFDEEIEVYDPDLPNGGSYHGQSGARRILAQLLDGFEQVEVKEFELHPVGDRVVGLIHTYMRGRRGMEIEIRDAHTWTFRDGKVVYWRLYLDQAEALADAGLAPSADQPSASSP
jgi:ketosteroid isomerase-like protein